MRRNRKKAKDTSVKVLCGICSEFFRSPRQCLECSNWNVCPPCLAKESEAIRKRLAKLGITI